jgi:hypothetical protein
MAELTHGLAAADIIFHDALGPTNCSAFYLEIILN